MTDYPMDIQLVVDPLNPDNIVANGEIWIYDPSDTAGVSPLALKDLSGLPLPQPLVSNGFGFLQPFLPPVPQVKWKSGSFEGFFNSYVGLRDVALGAVAAAEGMSVGTVTTVDPGVPAAVVLSGVAPDRKFDFSIPQGTPGSDGSNVLPTDLAIKDAINNPASETTAALRDTYVPKWKATTAYLAGDKVLSPAGDVVSAKVDFTSGASYSAANWDLSTTYEGQAVSGSTWPAAAQRASRRRDKGIDAAAEFGVPIAADLASATTDMYSLGLSASVAAVPTGGGELFLRRGFTRTGTRLFVKQGTTLRGEGVDATTLYITGSGFNGAVSDVLVKDMTILSDNPSARQLFHAIASGGMKNWRFENVKFKDIGIKMGRLGATLPDSSTLTTGCGIDEHIEFDHCEFQGWLEDGMVWSQGVHNVSVNRSRFHDIGTSTTKGDALKFSYGAKRGRATYNDFYDLQRDAIDVYDAHSVDVIGNTMKSVAVCAVEAKFESTGPNATSWFRIHDNTATTCGTSLASNAPVFQLSAPNLSARGNLVDGTPGSGFRAGPATNDALVRATEGAWMDNRAYGCGGDGFSLLGTDRHFIQGNVSKGNTGRGYYVPASTNSTPIGASADNVSTGNGSADVWMT